MPNDLPDRLEAGTQNTPGIAGLLAGLRHVRRRGADAILRHERALTFKLIEALQGQRRVRMYHADHLFCQTGVLSFVVSGSDPECMAERLSQQGVAIRSGLHCAPAAHRSAGTFPAGTVRVSVSDFNSPHDIDVFVQTLEQVLRR